jgi:hypothetical protein
VSSSIRDADAHREFSMRGPEEKLMKRIKRAKLHLAHETVRILRGSALRAAVGGDGIPYSKPQVCDTTADPECATNAEGVCRTNGCPGTFGCPPITNTCPPTSVC